MLLTMAGYMKADERRAAARAAAFSVLSRDNPGLEGFSLRHVAQEMDVSLSTLTYVYPSTRLLLLDMVIEYRESNWDAIIDHVGDGGLRTELQSAARRYFVHVLGDRARTALISWEIRELVKGDWSASEADLAVARGLIDKIAEQAHEHYRIAHGVLARMALAFTYGEVLQWVATGDDNDYWSALMAGIDGIVLLADPLPITTRHEGAAAADYGAMQAPDRAARRQASEGVVRGRQRIEGD